MLIQWGKRPSHEERCRRPLAKAAARGQIQRCQWDVPAHRLGPNGWGFAGKASSHAQAAAGKAAHRQRQAADACIIFLYFFGLLAIVGGATAAATAGRSEVATWIPVLAGALAAVGGGVSAGFRLEARAYRHARAAVRLRRVEDLGKDEYGRLTAEGGTADDASRALNVVQKLLDEAREETAFELGSPDQVATTGGAEPRSWRTLMLGVRSGCPFGRGP